MPLSKSENQISKASLLGKVKRSHRTNMKGVEGCEHPARASLLPTASLGPAESEVLSKPALDQVLTGFGSSMRLQEPKSPKVTLDAQGK